jgi:AcrR family transcriptional regulator
LTQRKARKEATRSRVIEAARALFEEVGYQETPVRAIAQRAGVSVGGVFTTFDGKAGILSHIVNQGRAALLDEVLSATRTLAGTTEDKLKTLMSMIHEAEAARLRTVAAYIGASYGWSRELEDSHRAVNRRLAEAIKSVLSDGVEAGEIARDADLEALFDLINAAYLRNYRAAWHDGMGAKELDDCMARQLPILLNGVRP